MRRRERALIYARVSHDPKGRGRSVDSQVVECRADCDRHGFDVIDEVRDVDRSASRHATRAREGWERVVKLVEHGDVDVLVTWESSRATRSIVSFVELSALCERTGTKWMYGGVVHDFAATDDRFRLGLDAVIAEHESDRTAERVRRGQRAAAEEGRPTGRVLYGYRRVYDENSGDPIGQVADPETAPIVAEIAERFVAGESLRALAADLNERGVPTATGVGVWRNKRLTDMLQNPSYAGLRVYQGEVIGRGNWEPIIGEETWAKVCAKLADPSRRTRRDGKATYLLSGVARCGVCGGPLYFGKTSGNPKRRYVCRENNCVSRLAEPLEAMVVDAVRERLSRPDAGDILDVEPTAEMLDTRREIDVLRQRLADATDEFVAGKLTAPTLARVEGKLLGEIAELERRSRRAVPLPSAIVEVIDSGRDWDDLSTEQQREIVRAVCVVRVHRAKTRGKRSFDPTDVEIEWLV